MTVFLSNVDRLCTPRESESVCVPVLSLPIPIRIGGVTSMGGAWSEIEFVSHAFGTHCGTVQNLCGYV